MGATIKIPKERLEDYFGEFTKRFLRHGSPEAIDVEMLSADLGDQHVADGGRLTGITYDPRENAVEFYYELTLSETGDHRVYDPQEVWVVEEPDGFISNLEIVRGDGVREVATVRKVGLRRID